MKITNYLLGATLLLGVTSLQAQMQLTLEQAIDISLEQSPDLISAELNLERYEKLLSAQEASLKTQFSLTVDPFEYSNSRYLDSRTTQWYTNESMESSGRLSIEQPIAATGTTLSLNNQFGWQNSSSIIDDAGETTSKTFTNSLYLSLSQPLFTYNDLKYELLSIKLDYEDAKISYAITRLDLEQKIIEQFYAVYMAQEDLVIAKEELENAQDNYDIIAEKVKLDMVPRSEQFQAELNLSSAESTLSTSELSLDTTKDNFKQLLGIPLRTDLFVVAEVIEESISVDLDLAVQHALTNRLELKQRDITNQNAEISLKQIKDNGSFNGDLSLSFGVMGDNPAFDNIYNTPTRNPSVSLSFSIPIFDWGARRDRIKAQKLLMEMNSVDEDQELIDIEMEVINSYRTLNNLAKQIEIAKTSVVNAQLTYDLNVEYYRAGEITGMEMNEFQSQLSSQKTSLLQTMVDYKLEIVNMKCLSFYDFEKQEPIAPMLMYNPESMKEYSEYNNKKKR